MSPGAESGMIGYDVSTYGDRIASSYDLRYEGREDQDAAVDTLVQLATDRTAFEFGIGTGRLAIPLHARGVSVSGVDVSPKMLEQLKSKAGGNGLDVTVGDIVDVSLGRTFSLIYAALNTMFYLGTADRQRLAFRRAAAHLDRGGLFLVETSIIDLTRYRSGQRVAVGSMTSDTLRLEASLFDNASQVFHFQTIDISEQGVKIVPEVLRYASPLDLDSVALDEGFRLRHRWGSWKQEAFDASSRWQIAVYESV